MTNTTNAGVEALKIVLLAIMAIALGVAVFFCVTEVGKLNSRAASLEVCLKTNGLASNGTPLIGCPNTPISAGEISSLKGEANTLGSLGWIAFFLDVSVVGSSVFEILTD
jgi:hypothetical protein